MCSNVDKSKEGGTPENAKKEPPGGGEARYVLKFGFFQ